jgi:hypothetical protein
MRQLSLYNGCSHDTGATAFATALQPEVESATFRDETHVLCLVDPKPLSARG